MAGNHKFVFLVRGHVVLVAVAYTQESVTQVSHYYYHYFTQCIIILIVIIRTFFISTKP